MKKLAIYIILIMVLTSCFEEQEFSVASETNNVSLSKTEVSLQEGTDTEVTVNVVFSGTTLSQDLNVPLVIVSDASTAIEGTDYSISTSISSLVIPAGEYTVPLTITVLDNEEAVGPRTLVLNLAEVPGYDMGYLGKEDGRTFTITILEDDAITFGYTSFEEPTAGLINNFASQGGADQVNVDGQNSVDFVFIDGEMGFNTSYVEGEEGGADDELFFGVTSFTSDDDWGYDVGNFPDGSQAYGSSDADGLAEIVFDELTIPDFVSKLQVSMDLWFIEGSWEEDDEFDIFWRTEDGDEIILSLRSDGVAMTNSADGTGDIIVDVWTSFALEVENIKTGSLVIQIGSDSGSEISFIDNIVIKGF